ncbi:MAG: CFI-box-CTERM domain-containing protein [Planctomycetota bacterium]|nr:CFI-box-CTERM domain-containing protein [Planctomycetota bacterium]
MSRPTTPRTSNWPVQTVDDTGNVGLFCKVESIPFWGGVRIAYYNSTEAAVQVATLEPGAPGWTIERVTEDGYDMGINTAFGLDPAGKAILVFQNNTVSVNDQGLVFGRELPEGWQVYSLDEEGITGFDAVLVVDSYGYPHVAYNNFGTLLYARFNGEGWTITEIDSGDVGFGISLSLDEDDNAAITYWNNGSLYYVDVADNHFEGKIVNRYTQTSLVDDSTETGGGGGGGCFVATAAFGSMATSSVSALCSVRDSALAGSAQGTRLVGLYYAASPSVAVEMGSSDAVRVLVRRLLGN